MTTATQDVITCSGCGATVHPAFNPAVAPGICENCQDERVDCPTCGATGTVEVTITDWTPSGATSHKRAMPCVQCGGRASVTHAVAKQIERDRAVWCSCGNPSHKEIPYSGNGPLGHGWTCADCGKLTQVG